MMMENSMNTQSAKTIRSDASLPLEQIVNIIHIDNMIDHSYVYGKDFTCANYCCRHVRRHSEEKPSQGNACEKAFARPSNL